MYTLIHVILHVSTVLTVAAINKLVANRVINRDQLNLPTRAWIAPYIVEEEEMQNS